MTTATIEQDINKARARIKLTGVTFVINFKSRVRHQLVSEIKKRRPGTRIYFQILCRVLLGILFLNWAIARVLDGNNQTTYLHLIKRYKTTWIFQLVSIRNFPMKARFMSFFCQSSRLRRSILRRLLARTITVKAPLLNNLPPKDQIKYKGIIRQNECFENDAPILEITPKLILVFLC